MAHAASGPKALRRQDPSDPFRPFHYKRPLLENIIHIQFFGFTRRVDPIGIEMKKLPGIRAAI